MTNAYMYRCVDIQQTGRRVMAPFHSGLIEYLYNRMLSLKSLSASQARKALNSTASEWLQREFRLLGYLAAVPGNDAMETDEVVRTP